MQEKLDPGQVFEKGIYSFIILMAYHLLHALIHFMHQRLYGTFMNKT